MDESKLSEQMDDYKYYHQPNPDGAFAHDLTSDYSKAYDHSWGNEPYSKESFNILKSIRGKADADLTIYRAAPSHVKDIGIGNWVTPSRKYAELHRDSNGEEGWHILEKTVPAHEVRWEANDINEFGYFPGFT
jgi:hypothetical protein